jgi:DNA-binding transcriptional regulator GbsR (MarR family)
MSEIDFNPEIFTNNKWSILQIIAEEPTSPSELAAKTNSSISNITQQLKLLEAYRIVSKAKSDEKNAGKPKTIYSINTQMIFSTILRQGMAERRVFNINESNSMLLNILFLTSPEDAFFITKFSFKYEDILKKCKAIGFLKSTRDNIELFLITEQLDEIRSKFSNIFIEDNNNKTKKIINWSHNEFEINDGLGRKDKYFMDMIKNVEVIHDPGRILSKIKDLRRGIK